MAKKNYKYKTVKGLLSDPKRWCKGKYHNGKGAHCLWGSVEEVYDGVQLTEALRKIKKAIVELYPKFADPELNINCFSVEEFNDAKHRTHAQIMKVLERANV